MSFAVEREENMNKVIKYLEKRVERLKKACRERYILFRSVGKRRT